MSVIFPRIVRDCFLSTWHDLNYPVHSTNMYLEHKQSVQY